jgi:predicted Zn-ribbon and HTH transcriptional regulator
MRQPLEYESRQKKHRCPFCRSTSTTSGDLLARDTHAVKFVPHNLKFLARTFKRAGVLIVQTPMVCRDCGALWSAVDAPELREVLARWAKEDDA